MLVRRFRDWGSFCTTRQMTKLNSWIRKKEGDLHLIKGSENFWRIEINWSNKWKILYQIMDQSKDTSHLFDLLLSFWYHKTWCVYDLSRSVLQPITWSYLTTEYRDQFPSYCRPLRAGIPSISAGIIRTAIDTTSGIRSKEEGRNLFT